MKYIAVKNDNQFFFNCSTLGDKCKSQCYFKCTERFYCSFYVDDLTFLNKLRTNDKVWAIQNLQSDNEQLKELAKLIINNVEINYDNL